MDTAEEKLLERFRRLPPEQRQTLQDLAAWLVDRYGTRTQTVPDTPLDIPRPAEESVVAAIRRLSQTYPMLNRDELLHRTSSYMTRHVMQGEDRVAIIDELEVYFRECYQRHAGPPDDDGV